jgi:hypothetical protein
MKIYLAFQFFYFEHMYLIIVIYETCSGYYIKYLRFYLNNDGQQLQ